MGLWLGFPVTEAIPFLGTCSRAKESEDLGFAYKETKHIPQ